VDTASARCSANCGPRRCVGLRYGQLNKGLRKQVNKGGAEKESGAKRKRDDHSALKRSSSDGQMNLKRQEVDCTFISGQMRLGIDLLTCVDAKVKIAVRSVPL